MSSKGYFGGEDNRARDYFARLRGREAVEGQPDAYDMVGLELDGSTGDTEIVSDYAENLFLFLELWTEYLYDESLSRYGWLDIDLPCFFEAQYNIRSNYSITFFIILLLLFSGFYYFCIFYLIFAISWNVFDEDPENDPEDPKVFMFELSKYIKAKRAQHKRIKLEQWMFSHGHIMLKGSLCWQFFHRWWMWRYDSFIIDDLLMLQVRQWLGRAQALKREDFAIDVCEDFFEELGPFFDRCDTESFLIAYIQAKKKKKGRGPCLFDKAARLICEGDKHTLILKKSLILGDSKILLRHDVSDEELRFVDSYVSNWYMLKLSPYKYRKYSYLL